MEYEMNQPDPLRLFKAALYETGSGSLQTYVNSSAERVDIVKRSTDRAAMESALRWPDLQKTVAGAIKRRIKQLDADRG
jgi:hypothetical protein